MFTLGETGSKDTQKMARMRLRPLLLYLSERLAHGMSQ